MDLIKRKEEQDSTPTRVNRKRTQSVENDPIARECYGAFSFPKKKKRKKAWSLGCIKYVLEQFRKCKMKEYF